MTREAPRTWLGELFVHTPEECKATIEAELERQAGNVSRTARALDVSRAFLWHCLRKLDMRRTPAMIRDRWKKRFRIGGS